MSKGKKDGKRNSEKGDKRKEKLKRKKKKQKSKKKNRKKIKTLKKLKKKRQRKKGKGKRKLTPRNEKKDSCQNITCLNDLLVVLKLDKDMVQNFIQQKKRIDSRLKLSGNCVYYIIIKHG